MANTVNATQPYELKIKAKSLAAEAVIIRKEEMKHLNASRIPGNNRGPDHKKIFWGLRDHRTGIVRQEARATHLARAYIRGKDRSTLELHPVKDISLMKRVQTLVRKYSSEREEMDVFDWLSVKHEQPSVE